MLFIYGALAGNFRSAYFYWEADKAEQKNNEVNQDSFELLAMESEIHQDSDIGIHK